MNRTNIYLEDRQIGLLDAMAAAEGVSWAQVIRRLLDRALAGPDDDMAADLAAIDASFAALPGLDHPGRSDAPDREEHLVRMWGRG